ncbi:MAG: hypothetical protein J6V44_05065 [Methanobrevibacter sp.]|nr:hypothetical protein [Methanobrevibacter sp.]
MELVNYLTQIIVAIGIFIILCFFGEQIKKYLFKHYKKLMDPKEFLPKEEIFSLKQVHYLILILFIYLCIINFFFNRFFEVSNELFLINSLIDIIVSTYIVVAFYDCSTRSRITSIFLMPLASISALVFGSTLLGYWDFIRIPTLLYMVVVLYHRFLEYTDENGLEKLILILVSIIFTCLVLTILLENQNPINSLAMTSNAFTSNGYAVLGNTPGGILTSTFLVWSGYIISGVGTATLAGAIVHRNSKKKFEKLEAKIDNLERIITQQQDENTKRE